MSKRPKHLATPETAATIDFTPLDVSTFGPLPSLDEWMAMRAEEFPTISLALTVTTKSKSELVNAVGENFSDWLEFLRGASVLRQRFEAAAKVFSGVEARLLIALSSAAVQP